MTFSVRLLRWKLFNMSDTKASLIFPSVHMNGTSGEELFNQALNAARVLRLSLDAMAAAAPHARDYYIQGADVFTNAQRDYVQRIGKIREVADDMMAIAENIRDTLDARRKK